jgi:hypothetical protein
MRIEECTCKTCLHSNEGDYGIPLYWECRALPEPQLVRKPDTHWCSHGKWWTVRYLYQGKPAYGWLTREEIFHLVVEELAEYQPVAAEPEKIDHAGT